jgi:Holliday junction resolvase RusA-like endonuclease
MNISFFAQGIPKGQPRPRAFSRGGKARVYDPGTAEGWKSAVAIAAKDHRGARLEGAIFVQLYFYMPRPKSHLDRHGNTKRTAPLWHTQKPDADNLAKAVLDALTEIQIWQDDAQVSHLTVRRLWASLGHSGCQIHICNNA